jgi:hypothetical protein
MRNLFTFFVAFVACFGLKLTKAQAQTQTVRGEITSNQTWTADKIWELDGIVYVTNGAKLTIEPGTIIIGKVDQTTDALVITRGCQETYRVHLWSCKR